MAQSVERRIGSAEVTGPIPVSSSHNLDFTGFCIVDLIKVIINLISPFIYLITN